MDIFSVNTIAFTLWGYSISWLELVGTVFNFTGVVLAARRNILTWPIGLVGVALFAALFYQINLYADLLEQVFYLVTGIIGWWLWARPGATHERHKAVVTRLSTRELLAWTVSVVVAGVLVGLVIARLHLWLPSVFPEPADLPMLDSITTIASFAAQFLMMRRKLESWYLWIVIDVVAVFLYWYKGVPFIAVLYFLFLLNAFYGLRVWLRSANTGEVVARETVAA